MIKLTTSSIRQSPPDRNSVGQPGRAGLVILPVFPVVGIRKHGWPCYCRFGFPPSRARYNSVRASRNVTWVTRKNGFQEILPEWDSESEFPPNCSHVVYDRRVYVICGCGVLVAARFSPYHGTVSSDHRCGSVA